MADRSAKKEKVLAKIMRRRFLGALSVGAAGIALTGTLGCEPTSSPGQIQGTSSP